MVLRPYTTKDKEYDERVVALAKKIAELVVDSSVTYKEADEALVVAQDFLETKTRPVSV